MAKKKKGVPVPAFAALVAAARAERGLNRKQLAALVGCGNSAISGIERGRRAPSLGLAARIAKSLGIKTRLAEFAENIPE